MLLGRSVPEIADLSLVDGVCFCILDMDQAYLQAELSPESQEMCKINTPFGSFKFLRMPYGIASGPREFQKIITTILAGIENIFIYLDDILVWGSSVENCQRTLREVLERLEKYHIRLNLKKCQFLKPVVKYLGFQLDRFGSRPDPARIRGLSEMPLPKNQDDLRSWIGMITFFFRYVPHLSTLLHPLHRGVKSKEWCWGEEQQRAYDSVLEALGHQVLVPYSLKRPLRLTTDASPVGLGCVLSHVTDEGREEPITFASKTLLGRAELSGS